MVDVQVLKHAGGHPGGGECFRVPLGHERRLLRHLQDDRVPGQQRGNDRVHRGEPGKVPRRQHEHDAEGLAPDESMEVPAPLHLDVGERRRGDSGHVFAALLKTAPQLERRMRDGAAHLRRELGTQFVRTRDTPLDGARADCRALGDGHFAPTTLRLHGARERRFDLGIGGERTLDDDRPVDRRHRSEHPLGSCRNH